jgi:phospholipid/cholesterol/gamma-HCH transport system permease protein
LPAFIKKNLPGLYELLIQTGEIGYFTGRFFKELFSTPFEWREMLNQCYNVGNRSIFLVGATGLIIGMVLTLQTRPTLEDFGASAWIPNMVSVSIVREIGPIITALICAGKVSSGMGAELGSMRVTEQIDAMEVSGTNPFKYLVVTRVLATTLMVPLLVIYADVIAIFASFLVENLKADVSFKLYFNRVFDALEFIDLFPATIKTFFFGLTIGIVGCYKGYNSKKGTQGVGLAANSAVVYASMLIFVIDFLAVLVTNIFFES